MGDQPLLVMDRIVKSFPGVRALDQVSLTVRRGEVHVLLGENGAGKSTLMKILTGAYPRDSGSILLNGNPVEIESPQQALALGISMVYQESHLARHLNIAENVFLGREPRYGSLPGLIDRAALWEHTREHLAELNLSLSPRTAVRSLSAAQCQMVEIAKALSAEARIIILDEPTAALAEKEIDRLFGIIRALKQRGVTFIYISHRLEEIAAVGDRITVLRDGRTIGTVPSATDPRELIRMMAGREIGELFPRDFSAPGEELLRVERLRREGVLRDISFSARAGEIIGLAGLVGSGRTELARAVFGADRRDSGDIYIRGESVEIDTPEQAIRAGIGYLSEDRKLLSLALGLSIRANVTLAGLKKYCRGPFIHQGKEYQAVESYIKELSIRARHPDQKVRTLSGGNQQKVVVARWLATEARVLFFDEPTVGVDVGAKAEIFSLMNALVRRGGAIIFISSYLPELLAICDRLLVLSRGKIVRELSREEATQEEILYYSALGN
ncbi:MAG: D-xylose ABC transporter ATP-binding protein [Candidatus Glassbacteria bacterium RIFCSPLOWO2_12_FULL_58_11]|uniref:D-xylose ABC transporter ATP-binding protein n=1 Tax=Candidatus Glassbacteria bacterium RIFCSPLOWO2_12_FULL_58_11 TaxID=1817867 RepID=A0A1F5YK53_9BACT|nr:MAG: D-xylose ABC transporter ATP-binding protein [Candidatus Glassbacteria bacterium RIFCSPLOWO2_12_FULL_58_11]